VFGQSSSLALVITAIGPEGTFDADWEGRIAVKLRHCAAEVSERLGFPSRGVACGSLKFRNCQLTRRLIHRDRIYIIMSETSSERESGRLSELSDRVTACWC
jgi:hypothetical protein